MDLSDGRMCSVYLGTAERMTGTCSLHYSFVSLITHLAGSLICLEWVSKECHFKFHVNSFHTDTSLRSTHTQLPLAPSFLPRRRPGLMG